MKKIIQFGEQVEGYAIPVLNEREIRAAAGILFALMFLAIVLAAVNSEFTLLKYAITLFLTDILIRVLINPRFSPTLIIGRLIVRNQVPEYVGAAQKKFAWIIGIVLGAIMMWLQVIANTYGPITGIICMICLVFLFFESAFGICLGCKFYPIFFKDKVQYCPGEVCDVKAKQDIQKTSKGQILVVFAFVGYIVLAVFLLHDTYRQKPHGMFGIDGTHQSTGK